MSAHTPGPWSRRFINVYADERIVVTAQWPIKDGELPDAKQLAEVKANARLVSAAPDMLEALEKMVAGFDQYMSAVREVHFITQKQPTGFAEARAAIAKARGQS